MMRSLPSREELVRLRLRRFKPRRPQKKLPGGTVYAYRAAVREIYADAQLAELLNNLGRKNIAKPRSIVAARSAECDRVFVRNYV